MNEVRQKIVATILGTAIAAFAAYCGSRNFASQSGRLLGSAGLVLGWLAVLALVGTGVISPNDGLLHTVWLCGGALGGVILHQHRATVIKVKIED